MDTRDSKPELEARIREVDAQYPSPDERAQVVWELLKTAAPNLTAWDVICFAANYLGWQSAAMPWLNLPAKHICRLVYTAHYVDRETDIPTGLKDDGRTGVPPQSNDSRTDAKPEPTERFTGLDVSGGGFG